MQFITRAILVGIVLYLASIALASEMGIVTSSTSDPLAQANQALADLRAGRSENVAIIDP